MLLKILCSFYFIFTVLTSFAQLGNSPNIHLIANIHNHPGISSGCWGYTSPNNREYAILGAQGGTEFVDITDTNNIHEVGYYPGVQTSWREMKVYSHYCYVITDAAGFGLQIFDMQYLPDSIHFVRNWNYSGFTQGHTISQSGPYLYINGGNSEPNGGITLLDLTSNPENPLKRGQWGEKYVHDSRIVNDTIYACNIYNPPGTISIINASDIDNLITINSWVNNPDPAPHNCAITQDHHYLFTTDETTIPSGRLKVWNIQDINNVILETTWHPTNITTCVVHNIEINGNFAVIAHYEAGIRVVDISNPLTPIEIAWYDTYPSANASQEFGCWGVFMFPSGKIIGSDIQTGLYVVKTSNIPIGIQNNNNELPNEYRLSQNFPNPFNPSTTIRYSIPKNVYASIKIFDVLGKQVALLEDGFKTAGSYSVTYDASHLASGMYFYSLTTADGFSMTKKMILVK